jgi:hypothetical protein
MDTTSAHRSLGCVVRALRAYLIFVVGTIIIAEAIGYSLAWWRFRQAARHWDESVEPMAHFKARFPKMPDSPDGLEIDEMSRRLGIRLGYRKGDYSTPPTNRDALQAVSTFIGSLQHATDDRPRETPVEVRVFLTEHEADLAALEARVLAPGEIHWARDIDQGAAGPFPALLGHRYAVSVFLARALEADRRGDATSAARSLEASWKLTRSVKEHPETICTLIVAALNSLCDGVLRRISVVPPVWQERVTADDYRSLHVTGMQLDNANFQALAASNGGLREVGELDGSMNRETSAGAVIFRLMTAPYIRLSAADASEKMQATIRDFRETDLCDSASKALDDRVKARFPRWNFIGRLAAPSAGTLLGAAREVALDAELTAQVLEARALAAAGRPIPPRPSKICKGMEWIASGTGGAITITPSSDPPTADPKYRPAWPFTVSRASAGRLGQRPEPSPRTP